MNTRSRSGCTRNVVLLLCVCLLPSLAHAQEPVSLKVPTIAAAAAAAVDWTTTYHALKYYKVREANPLLQSLSGSPGQLVSLGAALDVGGLTAWNLSIGRSRPRAAAAGLWAMAAFRSYLAVHNMLNERKAARR
jgi:hypothetical protein